MAWFGKLLCNIGVHKWEGGLAYLHDSARLAPGLRPIGRCLRLHCGLIVRTIDGRDIVVDCNHKAILPFSGPSDKPQPTRVERYMHLMNNVMQAKYMPAQMEAIQDEADRLWFSMTKEEHAEITGKLAKSDPPKPTRIFFFPNGYATVLDQRGLDMGAYTGTHDDTIAKLTAAGVDWRKLVSIGTPKGVKDE